MKIGIIVHSKTGNTYTVAAKLKEKLISAGHLVNIERIIPMNEEQKDVNKIKLQTLPDAGTYDALIFGGPVWGFSVSTVLAACLAQISSLKGKKAACFVTQAFPFPWMGGNRAVGQIKKICGEKGAVVCGTGVVNWGSKHREKKISDVVEEFRKLF